MGILNTIHKWYAGVKPIKIKTLKHKILHSLSSENVSNIFGENRLVADTFRLNIGTDMLNVSKYEFKSHMASVKIKFLYTFVTANLEYLWVDSKVIHFCNIQLLEFNCIHCSSKK